MLQPTSRRFLRELDEASGGNNLHYIYYSVLASLHLVTRVWTMKVYYEATECSWNNGGKTKYYIVIFDQLQGHSKGLIQAPESCMRGPLTITLQVQVDKENSIEFLLNFLHYLYNYYMVCILSSHSSHVTQSCDVTWLWLVTPWLCDT